MQPHGSGSASVNLLKPRKPADSLEPGSLDHSRQAAFTGDLGKGAAFSSSLSLAAQNRKGLTSSLPIKAGRRPSSRSPLRLGRVREPWNALAMKKDHPGFAQGHLLPPSLAEYKDTKTFRLRDHSL